MTENKDKNDYSIFITVHAVERFYERAFRKTEEEAKELSKEQRYQIVKMIEHELKEEHPEAYVLGAGIYTSPMWGVVFVLEEFRVLTVTEHSKQGNDKRLKGGALKNGKKYGKQVCKRTREKYQRREESSDDKSEK